MPTTRLTDQEEKIRQQAFREVDEALNAEIRENGPVLIWRGVAFPREACNFRGLSVNLCRWLGLTDPEGE